MAVLGCKMADQGHIWPPYGLLFSQCQLMTAGSLGPMTLIYKDPLTRLCDSACVLVCMLSCTLYLYKEVQLWLLARQLKVDKKGNGHSMATGHSPLHSPLLASLASSSSGEGSPRLCWPASHASRPDARVMTQSSASFLNTCPPVIIRWEWKIIVWNLKLAMQSKQATINSIVLKLAKLMVSQRFFFLSFFFQSQKDVANPFCVTLEKYGRHSVDKYDRHK